MIAVAKGYVVLPKSVTPARIASNMKGALAASKAFTKEDIEKLDGVAASGKQKRYVLFASTRHFGGSLNYWSRVSSLIMPPWGECIMSCLYFDRATHVHSFAGVDLGFRNWPGQNPLHL